MFRLGSKQVGQLLEMALFHETRKAGLKLSEASEVLDVSMRTISRMSKLLKRNFARPDQEHELPRRIEFMLWAGPLSEARIAQALSGIADASAISEALALLQDDGRVSRHVGRTVTYTVTDTQRQLLSDGLLARVDALTNLTNNLLNAVYARFFEGDDRAFARTLTFRIRPSDLPRLRALYEEHIWPTLRALDAAAADAPEAQEVDFSLMWAPYDFINRHTHPGKETP